MSDDEPRLPAEPTVGSEDPGDRDAMRPNTILSGGAAAVASDYPGNPSFTTTIGTLLASGDVLVGIDRERGERTEQRLAAGRFSAQQIDELDHRYFQRPIDDDLHEHTRERRLTLLSGPAGSGRRTSAIHALSRVAEIATIVELDASRGVARLSGAQFTANTGYLVDAGTIGLKAYTSSLLRELAARLEDRGAFMIVTVPQLAHLDDAHDRHLFEWTAPPTAEVFRTHVSDLERPPAFEDALVQEALGDHPTVSAAAAIARRLCRGRRSGRSDEDVLRAEPESHRGEIREWFDEPRSIDDLAAMATLCCLSGVDEATFGREQERLTSRIRNRVPARENEAEATLAEARLTRSRSLQLRACRAEITTRHLGAEGRTARVAAIDFVTPSHAAIYLQEFWQSSGAVVQDETIGWLADLGGRGDQMLQSRIARLVCELAPVNYLVVRNRLLDPWAFQPSPTANLTAAMAIDALAQRSGFQDHAIAAVGEWAASDAAPPNFSAMLAFSGACGTRHPDLATERLAAIVRRRPDWTDIASAVWNALTKALSGDDRAAAMLVTSAMQLKAVQQIDISDPAFVLVDAWFERGGAADATILAELADGRRSRAAVARLVGRVWAKSNNRIDPWFEALVRPHGSDSVMTRRGAAQLLLAALEVCDGPRRARLLELMTGRLDRWAARPRGAAPGRRAVELARLTITHAQRKEGNYVHV